MKENIQKEDSFAEGQKPFRDNFNHAPGVTVLKSGVLQSPTYSPNVSGWALKSNGDAEFQNITIRNKIITISAGQDLQKALDTLHNFGGGQLLLAPGTYTFTKNINGYSDVIIEGFATADTIIKFTGNFGFVYAGTSAYAVGTITSISSGVNVVGSGTSWLANVTTNHQLFVGNRWYKIAAVLTDTTITLAEGYAGGATLPGAAYRAVKVVKDIGFEGITIQSSGVAGINFDDCRNIFIRDTAFVANNKGFTMDNCAEIVIDDVLIVSSTSNGCEFNTSGFAAISGLATPSNGGHGVVLNNTSIFNIKSSASQANTGDGYNITSTRYLQLNSIASSNGGQGIEFVSGNTGNLLQVICESNTSDGLKLTATTDDTLITSSLFNSNGGYGINIAAGTDDNNLIVANKFASNTSGAYTDSGTGTLIRSNIGATDNGGAVSSTSGVYTPTRSAEANMDSNVTMFECQYLQVGNTVNVSGRFTANPTLTATASSFEISLPVASNIGAAEDVAGVAFCGTIAAMGAEIIGVAANDTAKVQWLSSDINSSTWSFTFQYQVI